MAKFIKLTDEKGHVAFFNPDTVAMIFRLPKAKTTTLLLTLSQATMAVKETPDEIMALIKEAG